MAWGGIGRRGLAFRHEGPRGTAREVAEHWVLERVIGGGDGRGGEGPRVLDRAARSRKAGRVPSTPDGGIESGPTVVDRRKM